MAVAKVSMPEDHIGYWLRYVSNNVAHSFSQKLAVHNVTVAEWVILRQIYQAGETSPGMVASKTGLTRGAISKLIERLVKKGLVARKGETQDHRRQTIKLTEQGKRLIPKLASIADQNDAHFFEDLPRRKKDDMVKILKAIVELHKLRKIFAE